MVYGTTKEQFDKRLLAVKCRLREKNFTNNEKKSNSKPVDTVSFLDTSFQTTDQHQMPNILKKMQKHQLTTNNSICLLG